MARGTLSRGGVLARAPLRLRFVPLLLVVMLLAAVPWAVSSSSAAAAAAPASAGDAGTVDVDSSRECATHWHKAHGTLMEYAALTEVSTPADRARHQQLVDTFDDAIAALKQHACLRRGEAPARRLLVPALRALNDAHWAIMRSRMKSNAITTASRASIEETGKDWMYDLFQKLLVGAEAVARRQPAARSGSGSVLLAHNGNGRSPLHIAVLNQDHPALKALLHAHLPGLPQAIAAPSPNDYDMSPLHLAVVMADAVAAQALLHAGAPLTARDVYGRRPRQIAQVLGYVGLVVLMDRFAASPGRCPNWSGVKSDTCAPWPAWTWAPTPPASVALPHNGSSPRLNPYCPFPRAHFLSISPETFEREHMSLRRPVVLQHAVTGWAARKSWLSSALAGRWGDRGGNVGVIPYGESFGEPHAFAHFREFVEYVTGAPAAVALPPTPKHHGNAQADQSYNVEAVPPASRPSRA